MRTAAVGHVIAVAVLTSTKVHETDLDMMSPGDDKELKCFELADGQVIVVVVSQGVVAEISVCGDADKPKDQRTWTKAG